MDKNPYSKQVTVEDVREWARQMEAAQIKKRQYKAYVLFKSKEEKDKWLKDVWYPMLLKGMDEKDIDKIS